MKINISRSVRKSIITMSLFMTGLLYAPPVPPQTPRDIAMKQVEYIAALEGGIRFYYTYGAVLWNESRFRQEVVNYNRDGSYDFGVAQLNSRYYNPDSLYHNQDIRTLRGNARVGAIHFWKLLKEHGGRYDIAVAAYNCGSGNVARGTVPDVTKIYTSKVLSLAENMRFFDIQGKSWAGASGEFLVPSH